jgi:hypothetical protein
MINSKQNFKSIKKIFFYAFTALIFSCSALNKKTDIGNVYYETINAAGESARNSILTIKQKIPKTYQTIDAEKLKIATIGEEQKAQISIIDFSKFTASNFIGFDNISNPTNSYIVPFILNNEVVATVELLKSKKGWQIMELSKQEFVSSLKNAFTENKELVTSQKMDLPNNLNDLINVLGKKVEYKLAPKIFLFPDDASSVINLEPILTKENLPNLEKLISKYYNSKNITKSLELLKEGTNEIIKIENIFYFKNLSSNILNDNKKYTPEQINTEILKILEIKKNNSKNQKGKSG